MLGPWRKDQQVGDALVYGLRHTAGRGGVMLADILDDMRQVVGGRGRPPDSHQD